MAPYVCNICITHIFLLRSLASGQGDVGEMVPAGAHPAPAHQRVHEGQGEFMGDQKTWRFYGG